MNRAGASEASGSVSDLALEDPQKHPRRSPVHPTNTQQIQLERQSQKSKVLQGDLGSKEM